MKPGPARKAMTAIDRDFRRAAANGQVSWENIPLDGIDADPELFGRAKAYWDRIRGDRWAPRRDDINPAEIASVLRHFLMVDVIRPGPRYRYRLAGTGSADIHGFELTGHFIDELQPPEFAMQLQAQLNIVVESRKLQFVRLSFINREGYSRDYRVLRLPLSNDGEQVDIIIMVADFLRLKEPLGVLAPKSD